VDTRNKRSEREEAADEFLEELQRLYGVKSFDHMISVWSAEDVTSPRPGYNVIQVTMFFKEEEMDEEIAYLR
jgi:hypothetical protein